MQLIVRDVETSKLELSEKVYLQSEGNGYFLMILIEGKQVIIFLDPDDVKQMLLRYVERLS